MSPPLAGRGSSSVRRGELADPIADRCSDVASYLPERTQEATIEDAAGALAEPSGLPTIRPGLLIERVLEIAVALADGLVGHLLGRPGGPCGVVVEHPGQHLVSLDHQPVPRSHDALPWSVARRSNDRSGGEFRWIDRRDRLGMSGNAAPAPLELRSV